MPSAKDESIRIARRYLRAHLLPEREYRLRYEGPAAKDLHHVMAVHRDDEQLPSQAFPPRESRSFVLLVDVKVGDVDRVLRLQ